MPHQDEEVYRVRGERCGTTEDALLAAGESSAARQIDYLH